MKKIANNRGITLIALIVTIIVLLILAGISVSMLTGQNGILNRAAEAKEKTVVAQKDEEKTLQGYEDIMAQYTGSLPSREETKPYFPNSTFSYKEGDLSTGLVIKDSNDNEYVWVEVPTTIYDNTTYNNNGANKPKNADEWEKIRDCLKAYTSDYSDSDFTDTNTDGTTYSDDYKNMLKSVYTNGGFWIGRYEAGIPEEDTSPSNETGIPVSKKGATVWTKINYTNSKARAESMISNKYVQTGLITGKAWDTTCNWIKDSLSSINELASLKDSRYYGNYNNSLSPANENSGKIRTAGFSENWKVKNIYDLAGNVWEMTSEAYNSGFISRGGSYDFDGSVVPVSYRSYDSVSNTSYTLGFRVRLYIK